MARPPGVVHVVQALGHGGAEHFVVDLAETQHRHGHPVAIVEVGPAPGPAGEAAGVPVVWVPKRGRASATALTRLARHLRSRRPDVVHTHTFTGLLYGHPAAILARAPAVVHTYHSSGAPGQTYGRWQRAVDALLRRSGAVVVFSEPQREALARRLGPHARVEAISNGVPLPPALPETDRTRVRADLGVDEEHLLVLAVGGLRAQKDYPLLLDALALARDCPIDVRIVGEGTEHAAVERRRRALGLDSVRLVGGRDDARVLLSAADVLVNTSRWESMPIAVLEAMAAGCAVVVPDVGNLREVVDGTGLVVTRTPDGVADGLRAVAGDGALRARLADAGRARVRAEYSIDGTAERYAALYEQVLAGR